MLSQLDLQPYLADYAAVTGKAMEKFVCPLTLRECELDEICNGHVINDALHYPHNITVPIYGKPDHFYGSRVEKSFVEFTSITGTSAVELMLAERELNIKFKENGPTFKAFIIPAEDVEEKRKHLPIVLLSQNGSIFHLGIKGVMKGDPEVPTELAAGKAEVTWNKKFLPAHWVATMLKVAHLTLFGMIGYKAVFDPSGDSLRRVLAQYFYDNASREDAPNYFRPFLNAVKVVRVGSHFRSPSATPFDLDTLRDRKVICHYHRGRLFAMTLLYQLGDKTLSVTIPQRITTVDIDTATRLYDRLMAEDPELHQTTVLTRLETGGWRPEGKINLHYEPTRSPAVPL